MDMYQKVNDKFGNSPAIVFLFIASFAMLVIGIELLFEDTVSSKAGLENIQAFYSMNVQTYPITYWVMSLAPQVASIVFFYIFMADTDKKGALYASIGFQFMDFFADAWYRSNDQLFASIPVTLMSSFLTLVYFSVGSEVFVTVGFGLVLKLWAPAVKTFSANVKGIRQAYSESGSNKNKPKGDMFVPTQQKQQSKPYQPTYRAVAPPPKNGEPMFHMLNEQDLEKIAEAKAKSSNRPGRF